MNTIYSIFWKIRAGLCTKIIHFEAFKEAITDFNDDGMLFHMVLVKSDTVPKWYQVFKVKNIQHAAIYPIESDQSGTFIEDYNLQGTMKTGSF